MKRVQFNPSIVVENGGTRLTSNAGAFLLRDVDDRLGMTRDLSRRLVDDRHPGTVFSMAELTRTLLYLPAQGFSDLDDGDLLRHDPAFRLAVSDKKGTRPLDDNGHGLPSQPTLSRALHRLGSDDNRAVLASVLRERAIAVRAKKARQRFCVVDVDSLPVEVHGHQKGSAYNRRRDPRHREGSHQQRALGTWHRARGGRRGAPARARAQPGEGSVRPHGADVATLPFDDILVVLADNAWKGKRRKDLEDRVVGLLAAEAQAPAWDAFLRLDGILSKVARDADARLEWQGRYTCQP